MFRITQTQIQEFIAAGHDPVVIAEAEAWRIYSLRADDLIIKFQDAFAGVKLGNGIGLREADGIDDYVSGASLQRLREQDEKHDWQRIDEETLSRCNAAPSFLDAEGMAFHLPAFVCANLRGSETIDIFTLIIYDGFGDPGFRTLLTVSQRRVIVDLIQFLAEAPTEWYSSEEIEAAILRYQ